MNSDDSVFLWPSEELYLPGVICKEGYCYNWKDLSGGKSLGPNLLNGR